MQHASMMGHTGPRSGQTRTPEDLLHPPGGLVDQLLATQLHALQLGAATPGAGGYSNAPFSGLPGFLGAACLPTGASPTNSSSPGSEEHSPLLHHPPLPSSDLLASLHMGSMGPQPTLPHIGSPFPAPGLLPYSAYPPQQHSYTRPPLQPHQPQQYAAPQRMQQQAASKRRGVCGAATGNRRNEDKVRRTVYISDISDAVTELQLAAFFQDCGQMVDCRVCGDPNSALRFAFIEFLAEESVQQALSRSGALLGDFPIRVSPSKTAIVPVNNTYLPRSCEERALVARTVFVGNIDRVVEREQLSEFFGNLCGPVSKIRLLGDTQHKSKIAFVEFDAPESAKAALKLSGALLGTLPLRVSPSKTPVRVDQRHNQHQDVPTMSLAPSTPAAHTPPGLSGHAQLDPALLMAMAQLQMYKSFGSDVPLEGPQC
ncbi:hypothetical protein D9Q98_001977 [Chlorella vulgaris]|uniref:RRM domain-containing protein n=1 Tax=Chlorella vulgaris TaxID=3077 RepID=A0A9D4TVL6_CHLVU|nr:hypothetical protein D9Q98_001977 [Chlorella vulgaris]